MTVEYQILYWRDIPAQVRVRSGRQRVTRPLPARFQEAIDEAAMRGRVTGTDEYLEEWRQTDWAQGEGEPEQLADRLLADLEEDYPAARLEKLKINEGRE
jgi:hypothetical protein